MSEGRQCHDADKRYSFARRKDAKRFLRAHGLKRLLKPYYCPDCDAWRLTTRQRMAHAMGEE